MYKFVIVLFAILAVSAAAPKPSLNVYTPVVASVVQPAVTSYSSYSSGVVHGSPLAVVPVVHQPVVHSVPVAYTAPLHTVFV